MPKFFCMCAGIMRDSETVTQNPSAQSIAVVRCVQSTAFPFIAGPGFYRANLSNTQPRGIPLLPGGWNVSPVITYWSPRDESSRMFPSSISTSPGTATSPSLSKKMSQKSFRIKTRGLSFRHGINAVTGEKLLFLYTNELFCCFFFESNHLKTFRIRCVAEGAHFCVIIRKMLKFEETLIGLSAMHEESCIILHWNCLLFGWSRAIKSL